MIEELVIFLLFAGYVGCWAYFGHLRDLWKLGR